MLLNLRAGQKLASALLPIAAAAAVLASACSQAAAPAQPRQDHERADARDHGPSQNGG